MAGEPNNHVNLGRATAVQSAVRTAVRTAIVPAVVAKPNNPLGLTLAVVVALMMSLAGIVLAIMNRPEAAPVKTASDLPEALRVTNADEAPPAEGKEVITKIAELESKLAQARRDIARLNGDLLTMQSHIEGLGSNLAIVQEQSAKNVVPVNVFGPQNEPEPEAPKKKN